MIPPQLARMMISNVTKDPEILAAVDVVLEAEKVEFKEIEPAVKKPGKKCYHAIATRGDRTVEAFLVL